MARILALIPSELGYSPGQRSTVELWERPLRDAGFTLKYAPFETSSLRSVLAQRGHFGAKVVEMARAYSRRMRLLHDLSGFDAVYVYREAALIGPAFLESWVVRQGKPIIYTLDDPLYVPYVSPANGWLSYLKCFWKVATICRLSKVVIVNCRFHKEYAEKYCPNVRQIPSVIDERVYRYVPPQRLGHVCVGWSGSASTAANLDLVRDALGDLGARTTFRLHVIGGERLDIPGVVCTAQPWNGSREVEDLRTLDIGLAPLPDNPWNRRKFNLKVAQYMALGIVPVASPLGSNPEIIEDGLDGYLASTRREWTLRLQELVLQPELRLRMARRAAAKAHANFTLLAQSDSIVDAFRSAF